MKSVLLVCLVALSLLARVATPAAPQAPALEPGVSVRMAVTINASQMPEADDAAARIVTVTQDGAIYFGVDRVFPGQLLEQMKQLPRSRGQKLYIKADARAPFADLDHVLKAARVSRFETAVLLTAQPEAASRGAMVPPKGLLVMLVRKPSSESVAVQLQTEPPSLVVNQRKTAFKDLREALQRALKNRREKLVFAKADNRVTFGELVQVIDTSRSLGANVVLALR
jgi:biopolymer transport protein ExbD